MYSGQHQVGPNLDDGSQHRSGGLCLMTPGLRQLRSIQDRDTEKGITCLYLQLTSFMVDKYGLRSDVPGA